MVLHFLLGMLERTPPINQVNVLWRYTPRSGLRCCTPEEGSTDPIVFVDRYGRRDKFWVTKLNTVQFVQQAEFQLTKSAKAGPCMRPSNRHMSNKR